MKLFWCRCG